MALRLLIVSAVVFALCPLSFAQEGILLKKPDGAKPKDTISYAIGWNVGQDFRRSGFKPGDFASDDFWNGVQDALSNGKSRMDDKEMEAAFALLRERMGARLQEISKSNADEAAKFLAANKTKEGVLALPSGLQYKVIKSGNGAKPSLTSTVKVHYEGKLLNGTVFDSSIQRGQPVEFAVRGVIAGWTEALQRMKVGDKWQLFIPPSLAYGENGNAEIGPNQLLTFEVELLDVK